MRSLSGTTLGEVVSATGGAIQTGPFGSQLHASDYVTNGTPVVMPINIGDNAIIHRGIATISDEDARRLARHRLRPGDILFGRRGDIGRRSIVRPAERGWICGTGCLAVKFGSDLSAVSPEYLALYVGSHGCKDWLLDNAVGGTMPNLNSKILSSLPVALPPKSEQDAAVSSIASVASLEESLYVLVAKKRAIKQGIMQELLAGRTRLPGFSGDWEEATLGSVLHVKNGRSQWNVEVPNGRYPIFATGGEIGRTDTPIYSGPSVLIGRKGTIDRPRYQETPFWTVDTLFYTEIEARCDGRFLYYLCTTIDWMALNEATGVPSLTGSRIESVEVRIPTGDEQRAIAQVLRVADAEIEALEKRLEATRQIKEGMMQELLTGRTRLV